MWPIDPACATSRACRQLAHSPFPDCCLPVPQMKIQVVYSGQEVVPDGNVPTDSDAAVAQLATALASNPFFVRTEAQEGNQWVVVKPRVSQPHHTSSHIMCFLALATHYCRHEPSFGYAVCSTSSCSIVVATCNASLTNSNSWSPVLLQGV